MGKMSVVARKTSAETTLSHRREELEESTDAPLTLKIEQFMLFYLFLKYITNICCKAPGGALGAVESFWLSQGAMLVYLGVALTHMLSCWLYH